MSFSDLSNYGVRSLLNDIISTCPKGFVKHLIIKFHSAKGSVSQVNHQDWSNMAIDKYRLMNWFSLYHQEQPIDCLGLDPLPIHIQDNDTKLLVNDGSSCEDWFSTTFFSNNWLSILSSSKRVVTDERQKMIDCKIDSWETWIDSRFKIVFLNLKSKLVDKVLDEAVSGEWDSVEIVNRIVELTKGPEVSFTLF